MVEVIKVLPSTLEIWIEFLALGTGQAQPQPLSAFRE